MGEIVLISLNLIPNSLSVQSMQEESTQEMDPNLINPQNKQENIKFCSRPYL